MGGTLLAWVVGIGGPLLGCIGVLAGIVASRRTAGEQARQAELNATAAARKDISDIEKQLRTELREDIRQLEERNAKADERYARLEEKYEALQQQHAQCERLIMQLQRQLQRLQRDPSERTRKEDNEINE